MKTKITYNTGFILLISFISALGGYLFGFDFAVISGALPFLKEQFGLNAYWEGFTTGSLALGCIAGCVSGGRLSERFGLKPALMVSGIIFAFSSLAMAFSPSLFVFIAARFVAGMGVGMASLLSPMYISEISPAPIRGRMVAINQLTIVVGILVTNLVNYCFRNIGPDAWRWMFGLGIVPSSVFFTGVFFLPESPRWLIRAARDLEAKKVLMSIGNFSFADQSFKAIHQSLTHEKRVDFRVLFRKPFFAPVLLGIGLAIFQQFCGINVVFNYTTTIFESIGFSKGDQLMQTVFIGAVNLLFTFLAMGLVDKIGRKPLMLFGSAGLAILYILIAIALQEKSSLSAVLLLSAIGLYATSLAPVTWVLITEIFPNNIRSKATSTAVVCLWGAYFILTFSFPVLAEFMGGIAHTFYLYAGICVVGAFFIAFKIKETKGKTLEEMDAVFSH